jgi:NtrC-family two-component system response regulator AlgB
LSISLEPQAIVAGISRAETAPSMRTKLLDLDVLLVDDDKSIRNALKLLLHGLGCRVDEAASGPAVRAAQAHKTFDLVLLDLRLGPESGLDLLPALVTRNPTAEIAVMTAFATIDNAVQAIQSGAHHYLPKPIVPPQLQQLVERVAARRRLDARASDLRAQLDAAPDIDLETASPAMRRLLELVARAAAHDTPVLLRGERGTGKQVLARRLHALSPRANGPYVIVGCEGVPEERLARELFGQARDAFLDDDAGRAGRVEAAASGTLVIDEIAELSPRLQGKLVRLLAEKQFERTGETEARSSEARLIAMTSRDLVREARAGRFREDLLARLRTLELEVIPLRDRREDILRLARRFLAFYSQKGPVKAPELTLEAEVALQRHEWPGNVRELCNAMERAALLRVGLRVGIEALPDRIAARASQVPFLGGEFSLEEIEREHTCACSGARRHRRRLRASSASTPRRSGASGSATRPDFAFCKETLKPDLQA